jgi:hypothetical protein
MMQLAVLYNMNGPTDSPFNTKNPAQGKKIYIQLSANEQRDSYLVFSLKNSI